MNRPGYRSWVGWDGEDTVMFPRRRNTLCRKVLAALKQRVRGFSHYLPSAAGFSIKLLQALSPLRPPGAELAVQNCLVRLFSSCWIW
ncbi:hypothetical protein AV530_003454 [Patagioenas fasciata monilis]|uniref:Uncharacterized protein n=1 Tax=Patagioenas fasciata monilis TaxID=372326 RepID=A0A1V4K2T3_PATFA|nr:hypothetical protein AV530_003454 [Patagioenas fasciata monilis]